MIGSLFGRRIEPPFAVPDGVVIRVGLWIPRLGGLLSSGDAGWHAAAAVTLGRTIVVHPDAPLTQRLLQHELAHVRQWQRWPVTFPLRYAWQHLRRGYHDNPFEVEARAAEQPQA